MKKIIIIGFCCLFLIVIISLNFPEVKKIDTNNDGKIDTWEYYKNSHKIMEALDANYKGKINAWIYWNKDGSIEKEITLRKDGKKNYYFFQEPQKIVINNKEMIKQELDYKKTYKENSFAQKCKSIKYIENGKIVFAENDLSGNGRIDTVSFYKNNRVYKVESDLGHEGKNKIWTYYENGQPSYSEYDSDGDGKPDKKGLPAPSEREIITHKMGEGIKK